MCICVGGNPLQIYDHQTTLIGNLLGRSFVRTADRLSHYPWNCDCGASYVSSAFSSVLIALLCISIALFIGVAEFRRRQTILLVLTWTLLIGYSFLRQFTDLVERVTASGGAGSARPIIDEYAGKFLASMPVQFAVDALFLLIVPATLALAVRILMLRSVGSTPAQ